ncbi:hypothetical protein C7S16_2485 [Burkholderia thailandensis]|uniref:Uncharacterized protein n=1 Tax=Burkholderia thailandensis TaxID=57975 RepID=A0AAW9CX69_BURTH|nr:hypothetical protein [Burkholderia thailandensis]MDW9255097.1 hypothetical protein [Burkholderia thailandensis]
MRRRAPRLHDSSAGDTLDRLTPTLARVRRRDAQAPLCRTSQGGPHG